MSAVSLEPLDEAVDHVRGPLAAPVIVEYGDYECPYSRRAFHEIERVEQALDGNVRFAFRHFPLTQIHPRALPAAVAAEAAAAQERFWEIHSLLFDGQDALEDDDLRRYAEHVGLDLAGFARARADSATLERIRRDVESGLATGEVRGTPTLFVDGEVYDGRYDADSLVRAVSAVGARPPGPSGGL